MVISEVQIDGAGEWVELYNPTSESIDLSSTPIYLCYYASGKNWNESSKPAAGKMRLSGTIPVHGFYLVRIDGTVSDSDYDWGYVGGPNTLSNSAGAVGIFPWDPATKTAEDAKSGRIDAVGWGSVEYVNETQSAAVPGCRREHREEIFIRRLCPLPGHEQQFRRFRDEGYANTEELIFFDVPCTATGSNPGSAIRSAGI